MAVAAKTLNPDYIDIPPFDVFDLSGGLNTRGSGLLLGRGTSYCLRRNQLTEFTNMVVNASGQIETRWGYTKINGSAVTPPAGDQQIRSIFELRQKNGTTKKILINVGNSIYVWNGGTLAFDSLGTVATSNERFHWAQFADLAIGVSRSNSPRKYDGATLSLLGGSPPSGGDAIVAYRNRVFIANGLTLSYCASGAPEDWTTANDAGVLPIPAQQSSRMTAIIPFYTRMIILCDNEVFELVGSGPADFIINGVSYAYGHEATAEGVVTAGNDVYWMSSKGVHRLSVTQANAALGYLDEYDASALILPTWRSLNISNLANRIAVDLKQQNRLVFMCSDSVTNNTIALVADYYHKDELGRPSWTKFTNFPFSSAAEVISYNNKRQVLFGDYNGFVHVYDDVLTDNGTNITIAWTYTTDLDIVTWYKTWRHLVLFSQVAAGVSLTMAASYDFGQQAINASVSISQGPTGKLLGVNWVLGVDPLGSAGFISKRIPIPGSGRYGSFRFSATPAYRVTIGGMLLYAGKRREILG